MPGNSGSFGYDATRRSRDIAFVMERQAAFDEVGAEALEVGSATADSPLSVQLSRCGALQ